MNQNANLELERLKLQNKYQQINSGKNYIQEENEQPSYWSFLKLRIGFSLLLLFFIVTSLKAFDSSETKKVQHVLKQINQRDPYTQKALDKLKSSISFPNK
ncbi:MULTISPECIES: hypothetical protein [Anaerostipes]|uniref:hypothetical protein n=1 Tax=Anaerostipes TaxID=207244 RepID=UPI000953598B|nr:MULTISPECIES: hypothetical protein [Anaerostipes]MCI5622619.1 hypothetical protein [Anaerostipes sp.]MDY2727143.1 hypothetical protein [Anaerostipes faecalis]OLR58312.1 hypothetical protein BHF70_00930 [Anaerostipes sp. 494a]